MALSHLKTLTEDECCAMHEASLHILKNIGIKFLSEDAISIFRKRGFKVDNSIVYMSTDQVEKALRFCPPTFTWTARNSTNSVVVGNNEKALVQPAVGPLYIQDMDNGRRPALLSDYANIIKICQSLDSIQLNGSTPVDPSDIPNESKHLYMFQEALRHTDKPLVGYCLTGRQILQHFEMMNIMAGGPTWTQKHWLASVACPLSPLSYARETIETMIEYASHSQIVFVTPAVMAGISGPISLLGVSLLQNTEILAGIVLVQLVNPGAPVVYSTASTTGYMREASYAAGSPEAMLINLPNLQMALDYYKIPARTMCGINQAKTVNCQAGYESMMSLMLGNLSGAHIITQALGTLDGMMAVSYEKMIIDDELINRAQRIREGLRPMDRDLAIDIIESIAHDGSYLSHHTTFERFKDLWTPSISNWDSVHVEEKEQQDTVIEKANKKFKEIIKSAPENMLPPKVDEDLRKFVKTSE